MNVIEKLLQQRAADMRLEQQVKAIPDKTPRELMEKSVMSADEYAAMEDILNRHAESRRNRWGMSGK